MVTRANELSRAVRVDDPIRLAETPPQTGDAILELDGDVRGIPLAEKKKLLDRYNGAMLAVSDKIVDTQSSYRDEVSEVWFVNSEGTALYQLRPEVVLSGTAIARRNGTIEKGLESIGLRKGWNSVQTFEEQFRVVAPPGRRPARGAAGARRRLSGDSGQRAGGRLHPRSVWAFVRRRTSCTRTRRHAR